MKVLAIAAVLLVSRTLAAQALPDIRPGETCEKLRATYGTESSVEGPAHVWKQGAVKITVLVKPNGPCIAGAAQYSVEPGRTLATRDGVILGSDTTASAALKLKGRINNTSYYFLRGEGKAYAMLEVPPSATFPFKGTYGWLLNQATTEKLKAPPTFADFTSEPVTFYSVDTPDPQGVTR